MKIDKKSLAARALGVGVERIRFNKERFAEIKEAITKQDMRDLANDGAISVKEVQGRKTAEKRSRRRAGSWKKKVSFKKKNYMRLVRTSRGVVAYAKSGGILTSEQAHAIRKEIKTGKFATKSSLRERIAQLRK